MSFAAWLQGFRELHARAKEGSLQGPLLGEYLRAREELAAALLAAQRLTNMPGKTARASLRIALALPVELRLASGTLRALTVDISATGFGAMVGVQPTEQESSVSIRLGGGATLEGRARLVQSKLTAGTFRVSYAFVGLTPEDQARLEMTLFDAVLAQMRS